MKKLFKMICIISLLVISGCAAKSQTPAEKFKEVFNKTADDELCLWVPDLERIDTLCKVSNKQFDIEMAFKLKNHIPLSKYGEDASLFREKIEELLNQLQLKETEKFNRHRILLRIACEQEEMDYLVIYDDMLAKIIHIDKNLDVHEEYYVIESISAVQEFITFIDSLEE